MRKTVEVVVFRREGCHLCESVEAEIRSIRDAQIRVTPVDIDADSALQAKYFVRVPVVAVGGREVFEAKMMDTDGRWRKRLAAVLVG